jgi:hypothetical protein
MSQLTAQAEIIPLKQYIDSALTRLEAIEAPLSQVLDLLQALPH